MNSKFLLIVVVLIVVFGAFTFLGGKKTNPTVVTNNPTSTQTVVSPVQQKAETNNVLLTNAGFEPKDIVVKTGTKVVWVNKSGKAATVNSDNHPTHRLYPFLNLGEFSDGSSLEVVFDKAGKYTYHNHYNSAQVGSVTVQ